jgi:hypothetical protein
MSRRLSEDHQWPLSHLVTYLFFDRTPPKPRYEMLAFTSHSAMRCLPSTSHNAICICICINMYICICMCVCVYVYMYRYINIWVRGSKHSQGHMLLYYWDISQGYVLKYQQRRWGRQHTSAFVSIRQLTYQDISAHILCDISFRICQGISSH